MSNGSRIEWTDATWNPTTGCRKVSSGCDNCYAATLARRLKAMGNIRYQNDGPDGEGFGLTLHWDKLEEPLRWRSPRMVFVNSMSDLFHKDVPESFVTNVFDVIAAAPQHTFQILTKRPRRMAAILSRTTNRHGVLPNAWLGTSIESDEVAWRADWVRRTPAAIRFLSLEPLLGPVPSLDYTSIDWVIVGGESGPKARPMSPDWAADVRDRCFAAGIPFFLKQLGGSRDKRGGKSARLEGKNWHEFPRALPCQLVR